MSVNIELPSSESLKLLAPQKSKEKILKPMGLISKEIQAHNEDKKNFKNTSLFVPGGQSTQLIVGASKENNLDILNLTENLYNKFSLKRVYTSFMRFIIHDVKRQLAIIYDGQKAVIEELKSEDVPNILSGTYEELWKSYFKSATILEKENPRLQRRNMPKRYWKNLTEI